MTGFDIVTDALFDAELRLEAAKRIIHERILAAGEDQRTIARLREQLADERATRARCAERLMSE